MTDLTEVLTAAIQRKRRIGTASVSQTPIEAAASCIAALDAAGYQIVPKEPSAAMLKSAGAGEYEIYHEEEYAEAYREMLAAAPKS
jgi:predicted CoA-binding protein